MDMPLNCKPIKKKKEWKLDSDVTWSVWVEKNEKDANEPEERLHCYALNLKWQMKTALWCEI